MAGPAELSAAEQQRGDGGADLGGENARVNFFPIHVITKSRKFTIS